MKLEVGKYYTNKHGNKAFCISEPKNGEFLVIHLDETGNYCYSRHYNQFNADDLISEWVEPVVHEVDVWFYSDNGKIHPLDNGGGMAIYEPSNGKHVPTKLIAKVKVKFTEGEGL